jgi:LmbE family N-acetylglucosaminyl deacetylase
MGRVVVFGAHPDDEVFGVGGTIAKLTRSGNKVFVVIFTKGEEGYADKNLKDTIPELRRKEIEKVKGILGVEEYKLLGRPDMGLENDKDTFKETIQLIRKYKPDAVFTHYRIDRHRDHRAASRLVTEAFWQSMEPVSMDLGDPWRAKALYYFEEAYPFKFPSHIVDITKTFEVKIDAMRTYVSQLPVVPFILGGIEGQATARGALIGVKFGEAFLRASVTPRAELEL